jgi:TonB family protein
MLRRATVVLALVCAFLPAAIGADRTLQDQLTDQYSQKILFLRHAFTSSSQEYDSGGKPKGHLEEGPWTFYGRLIVKKIVLEENKLQLEGDRVVYKFDEEGRYLIPVRDHESVKVTIRLSNPLSSMDQAVSLLSRVFAVTEKEVLNAAPSYWRPYLGKQLDARDAKSDRRQDAADAGASGNAVGEKVVNTGEHKVTAPKAQFAPEPGFQAKTGFSGVVGLNAIVDTSGRISTVKAVRSLGKGLDEEAICAVKTWRFTPGMSDGQPVAVAVYIEVDFHLYDSR